jgi:hypothetical protein
MGLKSFGEEGKEVSGIGTTLDNLRGFGIDPEVMKELYRQVRFCTKEGEFIHKLMILGHNSMVSCERELGFFVFFHAFFMSFAHKDLK